MSRHAHLPPFPLYVIRWRAHVASRVFLLTVLLDLLGFGWFRTFLIGVTVYELQNLMWLKGGIRRLGFALEKRDVVCPYRYTYPCRVYRSVRTVCFSNCNNSANIRAQISIMLKQFSSWIFLHIILYIILNYIYKKYIIIIHRIGRLHIIYSIFFQLSIIKLSI